MHRTESHPLFDLTPSPDATMAPPSNGTATSALAARSVEGVTGRIRREIHRLFVAAGPDGLTNEEIELRCGRPGNTVRPRVGELRKQGLIALHPDGLQRRTRAGRLAEVHVSIEGGTPGQA